MGMVVECSQQLEVWNREKFGNAHFKLKQVKTKLQRTMERDPSYMLQ